MLALAKPVKPLPFVRSKDSRFPAQREACFVQNATLKFARKSCQFIKVHIGSVENFPVASCFARFKFLHSLQVIFQFINTTSVLRIGKFFGGELIIFRFFQGCPLPASSDERSI